MHEKEEKDALVRASLRLAEIIRQHKAGRPIIAEMAARIHARSIRGQIEAIEKTAKDELC